MQSSWLRPELLYGHNYFLMPDGGTALHARISLLVYLQGRLWWALTDVHSAPDQFASDEPQPRSAASEKRRRCVPTAVEDAGSASKR